MDERSSRWLHIADVHANTPAGVALREAVEAFNAKRQEVHDLRIKSQILTTHLGLCRLIILGPFCLVLDDNECIRTIQAVSQEFGVGLVDKLRSVNNSETPIDS